MKKSIQFFFGVLVIFITCIVISGCPPTDSSDPPVEFSGTVYSDTSDDFAHGDWSETGSHDVDYHYSTSGLGPNSEGDYCIRGDYSRAGYWGGFGFYLDPVDLSTYSNGCITFLAKADAPTGIYLGFESNGGAYEQVGGETTDVLVDFTTEWDAYTLDINFLINNAFANNGWDDTVIDMKNITSLFRMGNFTDNSIVFYIDNIKWTETYTPINIEGKWTGQIIADEDSWDIELLINQNGTVLSYSEDEYDLAGTIYGSFIYFTVYFYSVDITGIVISTVNNSSTCINGTYTIDTGESAKIILNR